jgi:hypothetical protein
VAKKEKKRTCAFIGTNSFIAYTFASFLLIACFNWLAWTDLLIEKEVSSDLGTGIATSFMRFIRRVFFLPKSNTRRRKPLQETVSG